MFLEFKSSAKNIFFPYRNGFLELIEVVNL